MTHGNCQKNGGPTQDQLKRVFDRFHKAGKPPPLVIEVRRLLPHLNKNQIAGGMSRLRAKEYPHLPPIDQSMRLNTEENRARAKARKEAVSPVMACLVITKKKDPSPPVIPTKRVILSSHHRCQYIAGKATADDTCKCLEPTLQGTSWCPAHHEACYEPEAKRKTRQKNHANFQTMARVNNPGGWHNA